LIRGLFRFTSQIERLLAIRLTPPLQLGAFLHPLPPALRQVRGDGLTSAARRLGVVAAMSVRAGSTGDCVFCEIVARTVSCAKVAEDATTVAFMDIDPGSDGHLLVVPKQHSADLFEISAEDLALTTLTAQRIADRAVDAQSPWTVPPRADDAGQNEAVELISRRRWLTAGP